MNAESEIIGYEEDVSSDAAFSHLYLLLFCQPEFLWNLAEEYGALEHYDSRQEYIEEVMRMNGLSDDQIVTGQYIIIPYFSSEFVG